MTYIHVRHKVKNYAEWKKEFDDFAPARKKGGEKSYQIYVSHDDPNDVFLIFEWDTLENFKKFTSSEDTKRAMQKAHVMEEGFTTLPLNRMGDGRL